MLYIIIMMMMRKATSIMGKLYKNPWIAKTEMTLLPGQWSDSFAHEFQHGTYGLLITKPTHYFLFNLPIRFRPEFLVPSIRDA